MADRAMSKWKRTDTPSPGSGRASRVAWLAFPTDYLSQLNIQEKKKMLWIPAAPPGDATFVEIAFTAEDEFAVSSAFIDSNRTLISFTQISEAEALFVSSYHGDWQNSDLKSPSATNSIFPDLLFSEHDPALTGRPVRIRIASLPRDGDAVLIHELGGYKAQ